MTLIDFTYLLQVFAKASLVTIIVAAISIMIAIIIGVLCSLTMYYKIPVLKTISRAYIEFFRNTPSLIQAYFIFYGLPKLLIQIDSYTCSIIVLSLLCGAYMSDIIFSGIKSIPKNLIELATSIGLSEFDKIKSLLLPQAFSTSIGAINNNSIFLIKEVSAMKIILLPEILYQAFSIISLRSDLFFPVVTFMIASYLIILIPLSYLFSKLERRVRYAEFGN